MKTVERKIQEMPPTVMEITRNKAKTLKRKICLTETDDPRNICAAARLVETGFARPVLVGNGAAIEKLAREQSVSLKGSFALPAGLSAFGFDIAVDDDDSGKGRKTQLVWSGEDDNYKKPDAYGVVIIKP